MNQHDTYLSHRSLCLTVIVRAHKGCFWRPSLPGPNRAWLLGVYVVAPRPLLSLYGINYVTWYTSHLPKPTGVRLLVAVGIPGHVPTQNLPHTPR